MEASLLLFHQLYDDLQELCYIFGHSLNLPSLFMFCTQKVGFFKRRLEDKWRTALMKNSVDGKLVTENILCFKEFNEHISTVNTEHTPSKHVLKREKIFGPKTSTPCHKDHLNHSASYANLKHKVIKLEEDMRRVKKLLENLSKGANSPVKCEPTLPPPPPPPMPPPGFLKMGTPMKKVVVNNMKGKLQQKTSNCLPSRDWVLKEIKGVKLKPTERSPGGTPMRRLSANTGGDYGDLFKSALQKRFADIHPLEWNKENLSNSWDNSTTESF